MILFLSKSEEGLRTRRADSVVLVQKLVGSRPRKSQCFESESMKKANVPV